MILEKQKNETPEQYLWRLGQAKDLGIIDKTWDEIAALINRETGNEDKPYTSSAFRKPYQQAKRFYDAGVFDQEGECDQARELVELKRELEKERVKMRDERNELKRILREEARKESYKEQVIRAVSEHTDKPLEYEANKALSCPPKKNNDLICTFFDVHAGIEVDNFLNKFDENVLKARMNRYLDKIFEVQMRHGSENAYLILSELVSGIIHLGLRIENNQNLIEQFLTVTGYLSEFIAEISYRFDSVHVFVCPGNHSRVHAKKEDGLRGENMDILAIPFLESKMQNFGNVEFHKNEVDDMIAMFDVRGKAVFSVHGDKTNMGNVVNKLTMYTSIKPDIVFTGHMHTNAMVTSYDTKVLQAGCLSGGGDEYCMDKMLRNKPEQIIAVVDDDGLDCFYDVKLK